MSACLTGDEATRLRELEDRPEVDDPINRLGHLSQSAIPSRMVSCFAEDAGLHGGHGELIMGRDAILAYYGEGTGSSAGRCRSRLPFDQEVASTPVMSNVLIDLDGDWAPCESMCLAIHTGYTDVNAR
jgi:hypothetical protein